MKLDEMKKPKEVGLFRTVNSHIKDVDIRKLHDPSYLISLNQFMEAHGFSLLGTGNYGTVYEHPGYNYIIKVFMRDTAYLTWVNYCMQHQDNPYLPKFRGRVIKITDIFYAIRVEKLQYVLHRTNTKQVLDSWVYTLAKLKGEVVPEGKEYLSTDGQLNQVLDFILQHPKLKDIHAGNVMTRGNSQLVIIDPFYNYRVNNEFSIDPDDVKGFNVF